MEIAKSDFRFLLLSLAMLSYALFSLPFPRNPGFSEVVVAFFLITASGLKGIAGLVNFKSNDYGLMHVRLVFWFLLISPSIMMITNEWEVSDIIRDIIPLIYMFMPLFLLSVFIGNRHALKLPFLVSLMGLFFSIRFFIETNSTPFDVGDGVLWDNKKYFSYDPTVLFGAIWFFVAGFKIQKINVYHITTSFLCFVSSFICVTALAGVVQRAPLALFALACIIYFLASNIRIHYKIILIVLMSIVLTEYLSDLFSNVYELIYKKQSDHGLNNKDSEFVAVLDVLSHGWLQMLFGLGWGGRFENPAYSGMSMTNTHSIISYILIKAGLLGGVMFFIYAFQILKFNIRLIKYDIGVVLASSFTLVIGLLFQPTYKTLSYGVILTIFISYSYLFDSKGK